MRPIDADALEKDGWRMSRTVQINKQTMEYQTRKPTDFPTIEPQPEQRWIPCSERLPDHPENNDYYLVTIQCEHYDGWDDYVTGFAEWTKHGWDELSCYIGQIKVIAWMPLPEPYKEKER